MVMTRTIFALLALSAAMAASYRPAEAAPYWPWCSRYATKEAAESCAFSSREQCMQTVNGIGGYCYRNPYPAPQEEPAYRSERSRRNGDR